MTDKRNREVELALDTIRNISNTITHLWSVHDGEIAVLFYEDQHLPEYIALQEKGVEVIAANIRLRDALESLGKL